MSVGNIAVLARFRPLNKLELSKNGHLCVDVSDDQKSLVLHVTQEEIYNVTAKKVVEDVLEGVNGTILAYGQTSSGKTFSMMGPDDITEDTAGIIPRMINHLFQTITEKSENCEFMVRVSYVEIYQEKIRDLLDARKVNLAIREDKTKGIYIEGATEQCCTQGSDIFTVLKVGDMNRKVSSTGMNERSSRSHTVLLLSLTQNIINPPSTKVGRLYLVDLAGSEKISQTGCTGQQLEEAKKINLSLSALGNVINSLTDGKSKHIPYRDSKLTRILQETFGGNCRTVLLLCSSGSSTNAIETLSTMQFGQRAKKVKNAVRVNEEKSPAELRRLLKNARNEIARLKGVIQRMSDGEEIGADELNIGTDEEQAESASSDLAESTIDKLHTAIETSISPVLSANASPRTITPLDSSESGRISPDEQSLSPQFGMVPNTTTPLSPTSNSSESSSLSSSISSISSLRSELAHLRLENEELTELIASLNNSLDVAQIENEDLRRESAENAMSSEDARSHLMRLVGSSGSAMRQSDQSSSREIVNELAKTLTEIKTNQTSRPSTLPIDKHGIVLTDSLRPQLMSLSHRGDSPSAVIPSVDSAELDKLRQENAVLQSERAGLLAQLVSVERELSQVQMEVELGQDNVKEGMESGLPQPLEGMVSEVEMKRRTDKVKRVYGRRVEVLLQREEEWRALILEEEEQRKQLLNRVQEMEAREKMMVQRWEEDRAERDRLAEGLESLQQLIDEKSHLAQPTPKLAATISSFTSPPTQTLDLSLSSTNQKPFTTTLPPPVERREAQVQNRMAATLPGRRVFGVGEESERMYAVPVKNGWSLRAIPSSFGTIRGKARAEPMQSHPTINAELTKVTETPTEFWETTHSAASDEIPSFISSSKLESLQQTENAISSFN
ncbi:putative Kinesin heavy chain [Blattamonas nauphoetae]|uniref:Kinesin-like protein n=1 Tax=Blattamonas nauphoetae TaxID=2049346 RepID=A0ABQ9YKT7_9EUKA|nr:putative Kinesin heavy chain [Blattamonas nauphoetae]